MPKLKYYTDAEFKRYVINTLNRIEKKIDATKPDFLKEQEALKQKEYVQSIFNKHRKAPEE